MPYHHSPLVTARIINEYMKRKKWKRRATIRNDKVVHILCCLHVTLRLAIFLYKANIQDFVCIVLSISLMPHPTNVVRVCGDTISKQYRRGCQRVCRKMMLFVGLSPILRAICGFKSCFKAQLCPLPIAR